MSDKSIAIDIELSAVVVTAFDTTPLFLCLGMNGFDASAPSVFSTDAALNALPSGPFLPQSHRTFELGLRALVQHQTRFDIGYVEQLYSFGDDGRLGLMTACDTRAVSIGYLALTAQSDLATHAETASMKAPIWQSFYTLFPWEDWRKGTPEILMTIKDDLSHWIDAQPISPEKTELELRLKTLFPSAIEQWNEELVLERFELLFEAKLVFEANQYNSPPAPSHGVIYGLPMVSDHRRIAATALARLRGKLKYRPIIFELMPENFTLLQLQKTIEAITGLSLHKQNFRRSLDRTGFVTATGKFNAETGGRPAELYRHSIVPSHFSPTTGLSLPRA